LEILSIRILAHRHKFPNLNDAILSRIGTVFTRQTESIDTPTRNTCLKVTAICVHDKERLKQNNPYGPAR